MKDVENVLDYSPWGQTIVDTDIIDQGGTMPFHISHDIRVRFVSAKPIRQALLRMMELNPSMASVLTVASKMRRFNG
jgi:hypothetical protein